MNSDAGLEGRIEVLRPGGFVLELAFDFGLGVSVLFGPSGSGKTTSLLALAGLVRPARGRITLAGVPLFDAERHLDVPANQRKMALVFQSLALFPHLDALSNVAYGLPRTLTRAARREQARMWLARMRAAHVADRYPHTFSGGEAQRVALARALASEPRALLLDEPFSALDHGLARELGAELAESMALAAMPVLLVTHDRELARRLGRQLTVLNAGRVERTGQVDDGLLG